MKIAFVLTHNKGDATNQAQIAALESLVQKITDTTPVYDDLGVQIDTIESYHYELDGVIKPHQATFYQILPYGVTLPPNLDDLDSHKVLYGAGDEDKTGDHPRFVNWAVKRGTDYGADLVLTIDDHTSFTAQKINGLISRWQNGLDLVEDTFGRGVSQRALKEVGQLDETKGKPAAITDYKNRMTGKGLRYG